MTRFGDFSVTHGIGTLVTHLPSRRETYLQPGDDEASLLTQLDGLQLHVKDPARQSALAEECLSEYIQP